MCIRDSPVTRVVLQKGIDHTSLRVLLHEVLLMGCSVSCMAGLNASL